MKVVFDMVLNHTSDQHPWFLESRRSRSSPKRSFYIWRDGRRPRGKAPPTNWRSMLGGSGWHYDEAAEEWYWASFLPDPGLPRSVVAYRRGLAEGPRRDDVDVFLNFGDRPCVLDPREHRGRALFSSLRCGVGSPDAEHALAPHEGVVLFDPA